MSEADTVTVKPVRTYGGEDGLKHPGDKPYAVSRVRAAELRANRLIEYADPADLAKEPAKAARAPNNKMMVEPANKAAADAPKA